MRSLPKVIVLLFFPTIIYHLTEGRPRRPTMSNGNGGYKLTEWDKGFIEGHLPSDWHENPHERKNRIREVLWGVSHNKKFKPQDYFDAVEKSFTRKRPLP